MAFRSFERVAKAKEEFPLPTMPVADAIQRMALVGLLTVSFAILKACPIHLHVQDHAATAQVSVTVWIGDRQAVTDASGMAHLDSIAEGRYTVVIKRGDEVLHKATATVNCTKENYFYFTIESKIGKKTVELTEVVVESQTMKELLEASPFTAHVISMKKEYDRTGDVSDLINKTSGVKLRMDGSLGSVVNINLGGLQGKAIKIFKDGLPIELFGHGFSLGTIPTNMLERVEIYKGVMPVYLAADALGGGVNLVTRKPRKTSGEVSYEIASFNTHRVTTNVFLVNAKNPTLYGGVSGSFNYSDNDYKVTAPFTDPVTANTTYRKVPRFHDATRTHYVELYGGVRDKRWADDLRFTVIQSQFYKEIQHDAAMNYAYGDVSSDEKNYSAMASYRKSFWSGKLKLNALAAYSRFNVQFIDTATVRYAWDGSIYARNMPAGEVGMGSDQKLHYDMVSSRINAEYNLSGNHYLEFSNLTYYHRRTGTDPFVANSRTDGVDILRNPAVYQKNNMALSWRASWWKEMLESVLAVKYYHFGTEGYMSDLLKTTAWHVSKSDNNVGYLSGLKWNKGRYLLKASYEYAYRLPDEYEIFGDGRMVRENLDLIPEKSHNVNLNTQYLVTHDNDRFMVSANLFYRKVKDIIFFYLDIPYNRYINQDETEIKGVELEASYSPVHWFESGFNVTYQDIRRINIKDAMFSNLEGSRVTNIPYFFGNYWFTADLYKRTNRLSMRWNTNYTHRFFLYPIPKSQEPPLFGDVKDFQTSMIVPGDGRVALVSHDVGLFYHFTKTRLSVSGECRNLGNARLYDNFNVQRPGRSFHLKLVYQFL